MKKRIKEIQKKGLFWGITQKERIKQVTFFLCCHQSIEMIKKKSILRQGEQRNDNLAGSGWKHHTYVGQMCVCMCVRFKKIQIQQVQRDRLSPSSSKKQNVVLNKSV